MKVLLFLFSFITALIISILLFPVGTIAVLNCTVLSLITIKIIKTVDIDVEFNINLFLGALLVRVILATIIYSYNLQTFFGIDAIGYDEIGNQLMRYFLGESQINPGILNWASSNRMFYAVTGIYLVVGRNPYFIQLINALLGAATVFLIYLCAYTVFKNKKTARTAAFLTAFYPTLIVVSSQLLKDPVILFFLPLTILATLKLQEKFSSRYLIILFIGLLGTFFIRQYIFLMLFVSVVGSFFLGSNISAKQLFQRVSGIIVISLVLTYFGFTGEIFKQMENYQSLEQIQNTRENFAVGAKSSFNDGTDVSTFSGLITTLPLGFSYMMFAPFPWEMQNFRQSVVLPEVLIWWVLFVIGLLGIGFIIRSRLRKMMVILSFTLILTLAYSIVQSNVGQAHRQRTQIQIFYFIYAAVGLTLLGEYNENARLRRKSNKLLQNRNLVSKFQ